MSPEDLERFARMWIDSSPDPLYETRWRQAPEGGVLPGRERVEPLRGGEIFDRIGDPRGTRLFVQNTAYPQRSLPPDRLSFVRHVYVVDSAHEDVVGGSVQARYAQVGRWFGQPGGGICVELVDTRSGSVLRVWQALSSGVLVEQPSGSAS